MHQSSAVESLFPDIGIIHDAVNAAEKENGGELGIVDRPRSGVNTILKKCGQMIDDDVIGKAFAALARGWTSSKKDDIVQLNRIDVTCGHRSGPGGELFSPVDFRCFGDRSLYASEQVLCEALTERAEDIFP